MTGPGHYAESERLAETVREYPEAFDAVVLVALAQVHATLAVAAAAAWPAVREYYGDDDGDGRAWRGWRRERRGAGRPLAVG